MQNISHGHSGKSNSSVFPGPGRDSHPVLARFLRCCALLRLGDSWTKAIPKRMQTLRMELQRGAKASVVAVSFEHAFGCANGYFHTILNAVAPLAELVRVLGTAGEHRHSWQQAFTIYIHGVGGASTSVLPGIFPGLDVRFSDWVPQCCARADATRWCSKFTRLPSFNAHILPLRLDSRALDCGAPCLRRSSMTGRLRFLFNDVRDHALKKHSLNTPFAMTLNNIIFINRKGGLGASVSGAARRHIANHAAVAEAVSTIAKELRNASKADFGFMEIAFEDLPLNRQLKVLSAGAVLIGLHGAGLANCVWLRDRASVLELGPKGYNTVHYEWLCGEVLQHVYRLSVLDVVSRGACDHPTAMCGVVQLSDINAFRAHLIHFLVDFWEYLCSHPDSWRRIDNSGLSHQSKNKKQILPQGILDPMMLRLRLERLEERHPIGHWPDFLHAD